MAPYGHEPESNGRRRDLVIAAVVFVLALVTTQTAEPTQQRLSSGLRSSVLRPFIWTQERLTEAARRAGDLDRITAQLDTLTATLATHQSLAEENRALRALLDLRERAGGHFVPATVLRPGTPGSESMFIVDVGAEQGVRTGAAVVNAYGLVGRINEVRPNQSIGMDWSHPDFRVSAMLADGTTYGIVRPSPGRFREDDRLVLQGTAYSVDVVPGVPVLTSGLSGVLPRGIPVGKIDRVLEAEGAWRRSFWVEPIVELGAATHVLVVTEGAEGALSAVWPLDSIVTTEEAIVRAPGS